MALLLLASACASSGSSGDKALPPPPIPFEVRELEYRFEHPPTVRAGRIVVTVRNVGTAPHSLVLVGLPEDFPPVLEQLRGSERRPVDTYARVPERPPGGRDSFAVDLEPGRYALVCFVRDADGTTHAVKGMASEFRVVP